MTILHLLAVGESSWTRFERLEGVRDISLSGKGRQQMLAAALHLRELPISKVYYARTTRGMQAQKILFENWFQTNSMVKAIQKSQRVIPGKSYPGFKRGSYFSLAKRNEAAPVKFLREHRLNDINFGQLQGLYPEEIEMRFSSIWQSYLESPLLTEFPQGESMQQVVDRVTNFWLEMPTKELFPLEVVVITHRPIIQMITCLAQAKPLTEYHSIASSDGEITIVQCA